MDEGKAAKTLKVVSFRNRFVFIFYRYAILLSILSGLMAIGSVVSATIIYNKPVPPRYIPLTDDNRVLPLSPISKEFRTDGDIIDFTMRALKKLYTYDYINFKDQIQDGAYFFTRKEWNSYLGFLKNTQILALNDKNQTISSIEFQGTPSILKKDGKEGVFKWVVKTPVQIRFIGKEQIIRNYMVYLVIKRASIIDSPEGVLINQFVMENIRAK